jgi:poly-beta-1,6-N-acetyl-D-glucosamine synthase
MVKYIIISPVRNEEDYLRKTLDSVTNQTIKPTEWILVNDGSTDKTEEIIREYIPENSWIKLINLTDRGYYFPGTGVVNVFNKGYSEIQHPDWEYVVKLDCDLSFEPDYFEKIFQEFTNNPKLGIASGCTYLPIDNELVKEPTQADHPVGPSKVYKRECWDAIGGLRPVPGWDLADLLAAQMNNWDTACYFDLVLVHYRLTGSRRKGLFAPKFLQGRFEYRHGYSFIYTLMKATANIFSKPVFIGSFGKVTGYIYAAVTREPFLFEKDMRKFLRKKHRSFLKEKFSGKK